MNTEQPAKQAIELSLKKFEDAWNVHDANAFYLLFTEDADFTNVFGQALHGRGAIEAQHAHLFSTRFTSSKFTLDHITTRFLTENLTAVDGCRL